MCKRTYILLILCFQVSISSSIYAQTDWIDRTKHKGLEKLELTNKFEVYAVKSNSADLERTIKNFRRRQSILGFSF